MHNQAAFIPSYDQANFNLMPLFSLMVGLGRFVGLNSAHAVKLYGIFALSLLSWIVYCWLRVRRVQTFWRIIFPLILVTMPPLRWGALVLRPEIWQCLFWVLILQEIEASSPENLQERPRLAIWRLPGLLALAAGFHYDAVVWVVPTAIGLIFQNASPSRAFRVLLMVALRTLVWLSPWLVYLIYKNEYFFDQMNTQFGRLEEAPAFIKDAYSAFHGFFLDRGNPIHYPKFYNAGKILTWLMVIITSLRTLTLAYRERGASASVRVASVVALISTTHLWITKPEVWFVTLVFGAIFPVVVLAVREKERDVPDNLFLIIRRKVVGAHLIALLAIQLAVVVHQYGKTHAILSWNRYDAWIDCIETTIGPRKNIWQVSWPDTLINLSHNKPKRDYSRTADFPHIDLLIAKLVARTEVILHPFALPIDQGVRPGEVNFEETYQGQARASDFQFLKTNRWLPYAKYAAPNLGKPWQWQVCQNGALWAGVSLK